MTKTSILALTLLAAACSSAKTDEAADTSSTLAAIDTLKPAANDTLASASDTVPQVGTPAPGTSATKQQATGTKTAPRDTTNIGRDRALPINTKDPKVYLPLVDTTKTKRPPR
jgi:hypothetical protein